MNDITITPPQLTKAAIQAAGTRYAQALLDAGKEEVLPAYIRLRAIKDAVDSAISELTSDALAEVALYPPADRERLGVKFKAQGGYELYDFSHDDAWLDAKGREKDAATIRKAREKFLKALTEEVVNPTTGEFIKPAVVTGFAKTSVALTFPKG